MCAPGHSTFSNVHYQSSVSCAEYLLQMKIYFHLLFQSQWIDCSVYSKTKQKACHKLWIHEHLQINTPPPPPQPQCTHHSEHTHTHTCTHTHTLTQAHITNEQSTGWKQKWMTLWKIGLHQKSDGESNEKFQQTSCTDCIQNICFASVTTEH